MATWSAEGLSQDELMIKDECILLDLDDTIVGHGSKKDTHVFSEENPRGVLHRAFSVFLFNNDGKLLIQQRAAEKITFPNVWTNTCCSHPLFGCQPDEVDSAEATRSGNVNGVKSAAVRKLKHELGIDIDPSGFKYLTRLHYWAADVVTHGPNSPWGEHEIDYILFIRAEPSIALNPEEVSDVKYVSQEELREMMDPSSGLLWSPWFRIIAEKFLVHWWADLEKTLKTDAFVDYTTIYRFDPTSEHMGGAGKAGPWLGCMDYITNGKPPAAGSPRAPLPTQAVGNKGLKQGAYGKIKIHEHSLLSQLIRVDEVCAALRLKYWSDMGNKVNVSNPDVKFSDDMLGKVSRSFASVIRQLPKNLVLDILVFYVALRALDTIEDDMQAFKGQEHVKIEYLNTFYKTGLVDDSWQLKGVGDGDERVLLENYARCARVFNSLPKSSQVVIADITRRMGEGMASFVQKDLGQGTVMVSDYNLYCHYVAGLVGEGLSRLFTSTGYESDEVAKVSTTLANTMGLFLQKTNIIRDYLEDYVDGRAFWPREVWRRYTVTDDLGELSRPEARGRAVQCLNHLICDALGCVPECLEYMSLLRTEEVFRFCAIPQVMAIATLSELYNNPDVFTGVVKIRKGTAAKLIFETNSQSGLHKTFYIFAKDILRRIPEDDPSADRTRRICEEIIASTSSIAIPAICESYLASLSAVAPIAVLAGGVHLATSLERLPSSLEDLKTVKLNNNLDVAAAAAVCGGLALMVGYKLLTSMKRPHLKKAD